MRSALATQRPLTIPSTRRDAWVEVDLGAIEYNVLQIKSWLKAPGTKLMAVVKSDAYGHGATGVLKVLVGAGADWLAVASVDEGCQLRLVDPDTPILILGPTPGWAVGNALEDRLDLTVTSLCQIEDIEAVAKEKGMKARVHLKVDTGMHRLGVAPARAQELLAAIAASENLTLISVFSHLAVADDEGETRKQNDCFLAVIEMTKRTLPGADIFFHIASGDAARRFPFTHHDMVRVGLQLYGLEAATESSDLVPALSVRARINHLSEIEQGERVGYGFTWGARQKTRIASIPIGYADGVDRGLSNQMSGILMNNEVRQIGRISMDQMLFDITEAVEAQEGDVITLIGSQGDIKLTLAQWARKLDTITYELACRLRIRLPRIYTRHRHLPRK